MTVNGDAVPGCPILVRYADDVLALCHARQQAEQVQAQLARWLEPRGLTPHAISSTHTAAAA